MTGTNDKQALNDQLSVVDVDSIGDLSDRALLDQGTSDRIAPISFFFPTFKNKIKGTPDPDSLTGTEANDQIRAGGKDDTASGADGKDWLLGGSGNDTLKGDRGDDFIQGNNDDDLVLGGRGRDNLDGGSGNDRVSGNKGDDTLTGGDGDDVLVGGDGADSLHGGRGRNQMQGGDGRDSFVLGMGRGVAIVEDYQDGKDKLSLFRFSLFNSLSIAPFPSFKDLTIVQRGEDVAIRFEDDRLALIKGIEKSSIKADDFNDFYPEFFSANSDGNTV